MMSDSQYSQASTQSHPRGVTSWTKWWLARRAATIVLCASAAGGGGVAVVSLCGGDDDDDDGAWFLVGGLSDLVWRPRTMVSPEMSHGRDLMAQLPQTGFFSSHLTRRVLQRSQPLPSPRLHSEEQNGRLLKLTGKWCILSSLSPTTASAASAQPCLVVSA